MILAPDEDRVMRRSLLVVIASLLLVACSKEPEAGNTTGAICLAKRPGYDPKNMKQCVDACIACENGTTVTCTTSCTLKGAR